MVKAGKECKGFSPDDEELVGKGIQVDSREKVDQFAVLIQAVYRGWKTRKVWQQRTSPERPVRKFEHVDKLERFVLHEAAAHTKTLNQDASESYTLPPSENSREAALQYVYEHRILQLLKNLMSRVFYTRPKDVKAFLTKELQRMCEARSGTDVTSPTKHDAYAPSEISEIPQPPGDNGLGIFEVDDFPIYFGLLAGRNKETIPAEQLLNSMLGFCRKSDAEKIAAANKINSLDMVDEKVFCRMVRESVSGYYDISPWVQSSSA